MYEIFETLLAERGVTAYQVAKATGISTGSLSDWKNGRSSPKVEKLQKIATYFGVSVDYLLGNKQTEEPQSDQIDLSDVELGFLGDYKELTEENKATVRDMVRLMRERQKEG